MNELETSLDEVYKRLLKGHKEYGESKEEIKRILSAFNAITQKNITEDDYYLLMLLTKAARDFNGSKKLDNILDMAGYSVLWLKHRKEL